MKKSSLVLSLLALGLLAGCDQPATSASESVSEESAPAAEVVVLEGQYEETFGKNQDLYVTKVVVTVQGGVILSVEMADDSNHYTQGSSKWDSAIWTDKEAEILAAFEGAPVSAILGSETNEVFEVVASATVTSNRIYQAVVNALSSAE